MLILLLMLLVAAMILHKFFTIIHGILYKIKISELLETINTKEDLLYLHSKDFVHIVIEVLIRKGNKVQSTDKCGEFGSGLILNDIQYAAVWKHGLHHVVDVEIAMNLAKCMYSNSIYRGMMISLGDFKQNTRLFCHKNVIDCVNGDQLLEMCKEVQRKHTVLETG